ncbi:hypothetical protein Pla175_52080 [Pirellulimonas nuda]|uniref:Uncharacterized protein n=1 Tax=Pirellulimonas nuda TaxID=2528009 RepID=A0A518DJX4_9BACT|nr:hypothetical protein [Pirellulimonas nuda]QDU91777.1 hypothetical protein Pla175_52080 [Pirellulimonas nuda]
MIAARTIVTAAVLLGFAASDCAAQYYSGYYGNRPYYNGYGYGGGGYGYGYRASTAAEGYARGMAKVIQAQGQKNLLDSAARINNEDARSKYLDNRVKAVETYWKRRDIYNQNMEEKLYKDSLERQERLTQVKLKAITTEELNPTTGAVRWPALLATERYDNYRRAMDELMAKRAQYGMLPVDDTLDAQQIIKDWREAVTQDKEAYSEAMVRDSLRFLLKLNRELEDNLG